MQSFYLNLWNKNSIIKKIEKTYIQITNIII